MNEVNCSESDVAKRSVFSRLVMWCYIQMVNLVAFLMCFISITLLMMGVGALDLERHIEFFAFVFPTSWVTILSIYFLINFRKKAT